MGPRGAPPSPRVAVILGERMRAGYPGRARVGAAAAATPRSPRAAGQAGELQQLSPLSNFVKPVRRDAAAAQRLADLRALRDDQRAKEAEVAAQEAEHRQRPMRTDGLPHACGGLSRCGPASAVCCTPVVARMLLGRWQVGAKAECGGRCLGGGRWGQRQHKSIGMLLFDQDQAKTQQSSRCALAPCCSPSPQFVRTAISFESCANKSPNSPKSRSKCEIRIWSRRPSAARSKCRKFESIVAVRY